jgi:hypothetical protein
MTKVVRLEENFEAAKFIRGLDQPLSLFFFFFFSLLQQRENALLNHEKEYRSERIRDKSEKNIDWC